ncbi:MAG: tRNA (adenosine(37)-N6)-threonylcarbamoyltransferase complex ATPase subunit type 1 TsaE, partial [Bacteroidales bacterium]
TIVNEYKSAKGFPVYHFDFYRINNIQEVYDIGINEYFGGNGLCLIEWPEKIKEILPKDYLPVHIIVNDNGSRDVAIGE